VLAGCGAVVSTPNDMLRYARANLGATAGTLDPALRVAQRPQRDADLTGAIVQPGQPAQTATLAAAGPHT
jgi:hypothetical protein